MKSEFVVYTRELVCTDTSPFISDEIVPRTLDSDRIMDEDDDLPFEYEILDSNPKKLPGYYSSDVKEIPINMMQKLLDNVKSNGGNFIGIYFHEDHQEYEVYGFDIHKETVEEKQARLNATRLKKQRQIQSANEQILALAKKLNVTVNIIQS